MLTLASGESGSTVIDLLVILSVAGVVATLLGRFKLSTIPGFLIAGALIGPHAFGIVADQEEIEAISALALELLLFIVGLELDLSAIRSRVVQILGLGLASTLACAALLTPIGLLFGLGLAGAVAVAMALSISSTAVLIRLLIRYRQTRTPFGRVGVGVSVMQDLLSLVFLALLPVSALAGKDAAVATDDAHASTHIVRDAVIAIGGLAVLITVGRLILPRLLAEAMRAGGQEVMLVLAAAAALGAAVCSQVLGFSPEFGAFLAGFLLSSTQFRHQLAGQLSPMRDLFMAVFFTVVGLRLNGLVIVEFWWVVLLAVACVMFIKTISNAAAAWLLGAAGSVAVPVGLILGNAGEFSLVILEQARTEGLLDATTEGVLIAVVFVTLVLSPMLYGQGERFRAKLVRIPTAPWTRGECLGEEPARTPVEPRAAVDSVVATEPVPETVILPAAPDLQLPVANHKATKRPHVIIAGFGVVGRSVADRLQDSDIPFAIIELNPTTIRTQRKLGRLAVFGDITNPEVLESAGIHDAAAVVLTIPDDAATIRACEAIRAMAPSIFIAARTNFLSRGMQATAFGADHVTVEEVATAEAMGREVIEKLTATGGKYDQQRSNPHHPDLPPAGSGN
jgi:CPA2 family monovalent cation:H+ antiporter-2